MKVRVGLFAGFKDLAGSDQVELELPNGATVARLRQALTQAFPSAAGLLERSAIAVNSDFAENWVVLSADVEIAVLPPVSGG